MKVLNKVFNILTIISAIFSLWALSITAISWCKKREYVYNPCSATYYYNDTKITYTRESAKTAILSLFKHPLHIYAEGKLKGQRLGETRLFLRYIKMSTDCGVEDYIFAFTHELVHLTENVANERYTNFKAFVVLYESGDEQFKAVAERYLYSDLQGWTKKDYACGYYIMKYLEGV